MAVQQLKSITSGHLARWKKEGKTLEFACSECGIEPDEGLTEEKAFESLQKKFKLFCIKRKVVEKTVDHYMPFLVKNSETEKKEERKKKKSMEKKLEKEKNKLQKEVESPEIPESPEDILELLKKDVENLNQENSQKVIEKIRSFMLDFEIKVDEFKAQKDRAIAETNDLATEIKGLEETLLIKKSAYDEASFNAEILQESIDENNKFISQFKELVEQAEEKKRMLDPDLLVIDADFDVLSVPHGKEVSLEEFSYSDEEYKEKIAQIMQLSDFDDLSIKQIKIYAKVLIVLDFYANNENGVSLELGINEEDKANIVKIKDMLLNVKVA